MDPWDIYIYIYILVFMLFFWGTKKHSNPAWTYICRCFSVLVVALSQYINNNTNWGMLNSQVYCEILLYDIASWSVFDDTIYSMRLILGHMDHIAHIDHTGHTVHTGHIDHIGHMGHIGHTGHVGHTARSHTYNWYGSYGSLKCLLNRSPSCVLKLLKWLNEVTV